MKLKSMKLFFMFSLIIAAFTSIPTAFAGTGVFVNGIELNRAQWLQAMRHTGQIPVPGHYWYDARTGAWGPIRSGQGRRSGGDRFWSTGFSAGNSTADGSAGYVSVPGYGPVSYGM